MKADSKLFDKFNSYIKVVLSVVVVVILFLLIWNFLAPSYRRNITNSASNTVQQESVSNETQTENYVATDTTATDTTANAADVFD